MENKKWLLKHLNIEPPCGWEFYEERTEFTVLKQSNVHQLVDKVIEHRKYRKLLPTNPIIVLYEIQQQICQKLNYDESFCKVDRNG